MVESEAVSRSQVEMGTEVVQSVQAILQTQYLRYLIIASWALGLAPTVGIIPALVWFILTCSAGLARGVFERRLKRRTDGGFGLVFPVVATVTTAVWAIAPLMAWFSGGLVGHSLALVLIVAGYVLVFAQLRTTPRQALLISSPYGAAAAVILTNLWGTALFWPVVAMFPFMAACLFVLVTMTMVRDEHIRAFRERQTNLIEELEAARDRANAASEAKSNFLGVISHELRTPMNGVLGAAQLLNASPLTPIQKEYVGIIRNSGDSLLGLLNDILDMTKIEAGKMTFEVVEVDMEELQRRVIGPFSAQAEAKGLVLDVRYEGDMPAVVLGDPLRVCQVIQNLLSNAVKFTEAGTVTYTVISERLEEDRVKFAFRVQDSGAGIAPEDLQRLFQPFSQLDASSTRRFGGTGLGLTIARRMANIMGGDIFVQSEPGKGSVFTFTVTANVAAWQAAAGQPTTALPAEDGRPMKVLIVEDHPVNRMVLEAWMGTVGHQTVAAENGKVAVEVAMVQPFDVIIMDVNMPVMDGLSATRALRAQAGPNEQTPIVVLSASARSEDHEAGFKAGADAYVNKPIDFGILAEVLSVSRHGRDALQVYSESTHSPEPSSAAAA